MKIKLKKEDALFFTAYILYLFINILGTSFYAKYFVNSIKIVMLLCVALLFLKEIIKNKITYKEIFLFIICVFGIFLMRKNYSGGALFPLFFFIYSARNIKLEKIMKITYIVSGILLIIIILSSKIGIIPNYISNSGGRIREYLGFTYALYPSMLLFNITACFVYYKKDKIKLFDIVVFGVLNLMMYKYTDSRLSCVLALFIMIIAFVLPKNRILKSKMLTSILLLIYFVCFSFSYVLTMNYDDSKTFYRDIDKMLGYRLYWGNNYVKNNKISLFGDGGNFVGAGLNYDGTKTNEDYNYVDCFYINVMMKYVIIFITFYILLYSYIMFLCRKNKDYLLLYILAVFAIHGLIDDLMINLYYNAFWLVIGNLIFKNIKANKEFKDKNL